LNSIVAIYRGISRLRRYRKFEKRYIYWFFRHTSTFFFFFVYCMRLRGEFDEGGARWGARCFLKFVKFHWKTAEDDDLRFNTRPFPSPLFLQVDFRIDFYQKYIYIYLYICVYVCPTSVPLPIFHFWSTASIARPTLESYVRIFERSRNSWWFGYGVVGPSVFAVGVNRIDTLSPGSSSTIARDFSATIIGTILPYPPPPLSLLLANFCLESSTLTRLLNEDQSRMDISLFAICYYLEYSARTYEICVLQKKTAYKMFS